MQFVAYTEIMGGQGSPCPCSWEKYHYKHIILKYIRISTENTQSTENIFFFLNLGRELILLLPLNTIKHIYSYNQTIIYFVHYFLV